MSALPSAPASRHASAARGSKRFAMTVALSLAAHMLLTLAARGGASVPRATANATPAEQERDIWAGSTSLPGSDALQEVELVPEVPAASPSPAPAPTQAAEAPPSPAAPEAPARRAPKATEPSFSEAPPLSLVPSAVASARPKTPTKAPSVAASARPAIPRPTTTRARPGAARGGEGDFGSEDKPGIRDLARAFTRAIPPSSDSDPAWGKLSPGDAGTIEITVEVDDSGRIQSFRATDRDPPKHLLAMVKRTMGWLQSGTFALRGQIGAGTEVLALRAKVSDVPVPEGHPGGALDLRFRFEAGKGTASFTQPSGRRVEIEVRVVRVDRTKP